MQKIQQFNIIKAKYEELIDIRDVGTRIANNIIDFFNNEKNINIINRLKEKGLKFQIEEKELISEKLKGRTIVYSGTFSIGREELKKLIEDNGGKVGSSVSKKTDYFITGESLGPSKLERAIKENVKMITLEEFYDLL